jgi:RIO-like serine/threonine protein kinase
MQPKNLLKTNSITVVDSKKEVIKVVGTPFGLFARTWCRYEAECLLKLTELGFGGAPRLISSTGNSFTMEKIEGKSLNGRHFRPFFDEQLILRVLKVVRQLHSFGFAHGNLHPSNILITDKGEPVLIDFETCCQRHNALFFFFKFIDYVRLHLLWQLRVAQPNKDRMRTMFPKYVTLAMFIISPVYRFVLDLKSIKKRWRRSRKVSAKQ